MLKPKSSSIFRCDERSSALQIVQGRKWSGFRFLSFCCSSTRESSGINLVSKRVRGCSLPIIAYDNLDEWLFVIFLSPGGGYTIVRFYSGSLIYFCMVFLVWSSIVIFDTNLVFSLHHDVVGILKFDDMIFRAVSCTSTETVFDVFSAGHVYEAFAVATFRPGYSRSKFDPTMTTFGEVLFATAVVFGVFDCICGIVLSLVDESSCEETNDCATGRERNTVIFNPGENVRFEHIEMHVGTNLTQSKKGTMFHVKSKRSPSTESN